MTESTIAQVQKEARQKERDIWYQRIIQMNNNLAFTKDEDFREETFKLINQIIWDMRQMKIENNDKVAELRGQLLSAGDRRDWDECERIERELEKVKKRMERNDCNEQN